MIELSLSFPDDVEFPIAPTRRLQRDNQGDRGYSGSCQMQVQRWRGV
jgi:hypothetical protein